MNLSRFFVTFSTAAMLLAFVPAASAGEMFTGDVKLACEAVLCLATGQRPDECTPSITRYFSINMKKFSDTLKARRNFLSLCPSAPSKDVDTAMDNATPKADAQPVN